MMIGKILADYRYANRLSLRELAKELNVSAATLCRIEQGKPMEQATIVRLFNLLFGSTEIESKKRRKK